MTCKGSGRFLRESSSRSAFIRDLNEGLLRLNTDQKHIGKTGSVRTADGEYYRRGARAVE